MKNNYILLLMLFLAQFTYGQQLYCDFEGTKVMNFGDRNGVLDSLAFNPLPNGINASPNCAKYTRNDTVQYDNFKIYPYTKMVDVTPYANNSFSTPKITMKLYSTAPAGTMIQLQLGSKTNNTYPAGVHSEYVAATTAQNAWQNITFNYWQSTPGSMTPPTAIDKMVILFNPSYFTHDTIYIDDISGPNLLPSGISKNEGISFKLFQNVPNPSKEQTAIKLQLNNPGYVTLRLYDMIGNLVSSLVEQNMPVGTHLIPVETANIPNGIYFYELKKDGASQTMKMIISK
jgi:hypothetical protein